jgi:2-methylisocitrate lyase-like PEP mutase family enzyme
MPEEMASPATQKRLRLREVLARPGTTVMPGGFSALYTKMAEAAGFECFFLAGSQMSALLYAVPDLGILGLHDVVEHSRHAAAKAGIPVLVDADTGYGNAVNVYFAVQEFVHAGVASISIEDQEAPKKSSTLAGRRCIPMAEAIGKYQAAREARDAIDPTFVICARCDVIGAENGTFEDALERSIAYVEEGGADFVWLNSVQSRAQAERACAGIPAPVLVIWGGEEPAPTVEEYTDLGVAVSAGVQAAWDVLNALRSEGRAGLDAWRARAGASPWGRPNLSELLGADAVRALEERFLPEEMQRDYETTFGHSPQGGISRASS